MRAARIFIDCTFFSQIHDRLDLVAYRLLFFILDLVIRVEDLDERSDFDVQLLTNVPASANIELGELDVAAGFGKF